MHYYGCNYYTHLFVNYVVNIIVVQPMMFQVHLSHIHVNITNHVSACHADYLVHHKIIIVLYIMHVIYDWESENTFIIINFRLGTQR